MLPGGAPVWCLSHLPSNPQNDFPFLIPLTFNRSTTAKMNSPPRDPCIYGPGRSSGSSSCITISQVAQLLPPEHVILNIQCKTLQLFLIYVFKLLDHLLDSSKLGCLLYFKILPHSTITSWDIHYSQTLHFKTPSIHTSKPISNKLLQVSLSEFKQRASIS